MVFLFVFIMIIIIVYIIISLKINFKIETFNYNSMLPKKVKLKYNILITIYIFNKIPIIKIKLTTKSWNKIRQKVKKRIDEIDVTDIERDREINKKILEITKMLKINIKDFNLRLELGTEDAIITSFLVPIIGIIISYLLRQNMVDFKRQKFIIQPVYCNQNLLNLVFSGIFEIKMIHIINIIYVLIKGRGKEWKNERTTSNRRAYGHSYE